MAEQFDPSAVVRTFYAALNQQDIEVLAQTASDEVEITDFTLGETLRGREALKKYFSNWWTAFPKGTGEITNLIVLDDQVIVEVLGKGEQAGPFETKQGKIEPTNRIIELHFCQVFRIQDGLIVSGHFYSDSNKLFALAIEERNVA